MPSPGLPSGKVVTIPLAPRTARAIDLAIGERTDGPLFLAGDGWRLDRHGTARMVRRVTRRAGSLSRLACTRCGMRLSRPLKGAELHQMQHSAIEVRTTVQGDPAGALSLWLTASTREISGQGGSARIRLHQMQRRCIQFRCVRCQYVVSSSTSKQERRGQMRHLAARRAEVLSVAGNLLPTSFDPGVPLRDVRVAPHRTPIRASPCTTRAGSRQSGPARYLHRRRLNRQRRQVNLHWLAARSGGPNRQTDRPGAAR
jgi:hypothetical protein